MPMNNGADAFETQPCTRCGGGGWYSFCQTWGHTCFQCGVRPHQQGIGRYLTKRGRAAHEYYLSLLPTRRAADLMPGDVIRDAGRWMTVVRITDNATDRTSGTVLPDGSVEWKGVNVYTKSCTLCAVVPDHVYTLRPSEEDQRVAREAALAYQATLTKTGTVRKRVRHAAA